MCGKGRGGRGESSQEKARRDKATKLQATYGIHRLFVDVKNLVAVPQASFGRWTVIVHLLILCLWEGGVCQGCKTLEPLAHKLAVCQLVRETHFADIKPQLVFCATPHIKAKPSLLISHNLDDPVFIVVLGWSLG